MPKEAEYVKFKNFKRKIKPSFLIYANFESILVPEDNGKQNPNDFYTNKYQNMLLLVVMVINQYVFVKNLVKLIIKLACVDCKFSNHTQVKMLFTILLAA